MFRLYSNIIFIQKSFMDIAKSGKTVFICEIAKLNDLKSIHRELSLAISNEKYYYTLFGWPIRRGENGRTLLKL